MTFVAPFDGTTLSEAALVRATEYGNAMDEEVVAITLFSERKRYAQEKGWIDENEQYQVEQVIARLRDRVQELAPEATYEYEVIREFPPAEEIADQIEQLALQHDPAVIFLGTENIGRIVKPLTSVGAYVATEDAYDVYLVQQVAPPKLAFLKPHPDFYDETDENGA